MTDWQKFIAERVKPEELCYRKAAKQVAHGDRCPVCEGKLTADFSLLYSEGKTRVVCSCGLYSEVQLPYGTTDNQTKAVRNALRRGLRHWMPNIAKELMR